MKVECIKCRISKPKSAFWKNKGRPTGCSDYCKDCFKTYQKEWRRGSGEEKYRASYRKRASNPKYKERVRRYNKSEQGAQKHRESVYRYINKYPERQRARIQARQIRKEIANCESCLKSNLKLHKHHPDYSKPFTVIYLCTSCHGKEHRIYEEI